jgi:anaerobic ribonucleoside-triphosphate reductase activating protein
MSTVFRHTRYRDFDKNSNVDRGPGVPYAQSINPAPGQWDGRKMTANMIASYKPFIVTDGEGVRCSIYVSGCSFHCLNCWNESIWDYQAGFEYTQELEDQIIKDLGRPVVQGATFLGGEPFLNTPVLIKLAQRIRKEYGDTKDIWSWSGYTWEELMREGETEDKKELLSYVDILVDGRFIEAEKDSLLQFRGSSNQRIIDVKKSLESGKIVIWDRLNDGQRAYTEISLKTRSHNENE